MLVDHREQLVAERTRTINRLRWHLHQLDPDLEHTTGRLPGPGLGRISAWLAQVAEAGSVVQVRICQAQVSTIGALTDQIGAGPSTPPAGRPAGPIAAQPGWLWAADRGQADRRDRRRGLVPLRGLLAMHAGVAPVPVSSGRTDRHRLSRGGNRQLNAALHRIAITQLRLPGPGQSYDQRRRGQGDRPREAVRAPKRRIARAVYQHLKLAEQQPQAGAPAAA